VRAEQRIRLSHAAETLKDFACERVASGLPMPGVLLCNQHASPRAIADDLVNTCDLQKTRGLGKPSLAFAVVM